MLLSWGDSWWPGRYRSFYRVDVTEESKGGCLVLDTKAPIIIKSLVITHQQASVEVRVQCLGKWVGLVAKVEDNSKFISSNGNISQL